MSGVTTCSDASGKGGAVGRSSELTGEGRDFVSSHTTLENEGLVELPQLLVVSTVLVELSGATIFWGCNRGYLSAVRLIQAQTGQLCEDGRTQSK